MYIYTYMKIYDKEDDPSDPVLSDDAEHRAGGMTRCGERYSRAGGMTRCGEGYSKGFLWVEVTVVSQSA